MDEKITAVKQETEWAKASLLRKFAHVPDDKLTFSPSPSARTPLWIAAHCGIANHAFATILRGEELPQFASPEEAAARIWNTGREVTTRAAAIQLVEDGTAEVLQALENVTPDLLRSTPDSPFGALPFAVWMSVPSQHMCGHASQIDYLQTVWGDCQDH